MKQSVLLLTQFGELREYDAIPLLFEEMGAEVESIVASIHQTAMREFLSRDVVTMWKWEPRTEHMFDNNHLQSVAHVVDLSVGMVNRLKGCGYTTRKEVYDVFRMYHLKLNHWAPERHRSKANYKF